MRVHLFWKGVAQQSQQAPLGGPGQHPGQEKRWMVLTTGASGLGLGEAPGREQVLTNASYNGSNNN